MEIRSYGGDASPKIVEGRIIEGYAVVFGQRSNVMYDEKERKMFREIISPEAVSSDLLQRSDIKALIEHNKERLLARWDKGEGTLSLDIDEHGVKYRFEAPRTPDGDYAVEMVTRGDIRGSSFAFYARSAGAAAWSKGADGMWLRTINKFDSIHDVTITAYPAFTGTDVTVRSMTELEVLEDKSDNDDYKKQLNYLRKKI